MKKNNCIRWGGLFLLSAAVILIFASHTSPIYSLLLGDYGNNTASAAMLIGKGWAEGSALPYKDLFSMGGPLYFLIQTIGWLIAGRMGIFILEVISFAVFSCLMAQTIRRFASEKTVAVCFVLGAIVYAALCAAGNSTFEWCLPFIAGGYAVFFRPGKICHNRDVAIAGLLCGCVLLIDFRAGGLLYGAMVWAVFFAPGSQNDKVWKRLVFCLAGVTLPLLIAAGVFWAIGALPEMLKATFIYPAKALLSGFGSFIVLLHKAVKCLFLLPLAASGIFFLLREKRADSLGVCMLFSCLAGGLFLLGGDNRWYYYLAALPAVIMGMAVLCSEKEGRSTAVAKGIGFLLVLGLSVVPLKNYVSFLSAGVPDVASEFYEDAQSFEEENPGYGFFALDTDCSYFLLLDKMPNDRYFTNQTELSSYDPDIAREVEECINEAKADVLFITERGYIGRELDKYNLTQVYLEYGGSLFVYMRSE